MPNPTKQIIFIDSRVQDIPTLLAGFAADAEVHVIDASQDGLTQINQVLAGRSALDAIHLIGHGSAGSATLGSTTLSNANLSQYQSQLAELGGHLTPTGDLLLYGCNIAQGDAGQAFIEQIAQLTGADVAASTDLTGAAALGGDWVLEAQTGVIASQTLVVSDYHATLATRVQITVSSSSADMVEVSPGTWINNMLTASGSRDVVVTVTGLAADEQWSLYVDSPTVADTGSARTDTYLATPVTGLDNFPANTGNSTFTADGTNTSFKVVISKKAAPPPPHEWWAAGYPADVRRHRRSSVPLPFNDAQR